MQSTEEAKRHDLPEELPLLPVRDLVVFPFMIVPLFVSRDISVQAIHQALANDRFIFLAAQKKASADDPEPQDLYQVGSVGMIMRMRNLPDGQVKVLVQGLMKARIESVVQERPNYRVRVASLQEREAAKDLETEAIMRAVKENLERLADIGKIVSADVMMVVRGINDPGRLADLVASNLGIEVADAQDLLETVDPLQRLQKVNAALAKEVGVLEVQQRIQSQAREEMSRTQREYFLREQLRQIQSELGDRGGMDKEVEDLRRRIQVARMPIEAEQEAFRQLGRLERMNAESAEAGVARTYLEWLVELPWSVASPDNLDLGEVRRILDEDHYDLEAVKQRILEYLGVRKLKEDNRGPILCFVGPPGVGKTSLGRSIARALGRAFVRFSLGGVRDEAEIRGHRRTYVGSLPGRVIQGIKQAGANNPVFMIDEIDKVGADARGDPAAALLEVLDPAQNDSFRDHYLNLPFDLSNVMFITTANLTDTIPSALRDRMEIIRLAGYSSEEKLHIAECFILPRQLQASGLTGDLLAISTPAMRQVISLYTREAGLRELERQVAAICRKVAHGVAVNGPCRTLVTARNLHQYLGIPRYQACAGLDRDEIGIATGLAWTQAGGELLHVEATTMRGNRALTLTGHLGEVMKESARAALSFARSQAACLGIEEDWFEEREVHIHVPAGAIPKDGPSAGLTMATALISLLTGLPVRRDVAMTGEITLRGRVLPVGGLKEKVLAALRAGMSTVIIPEANRKDLAEIPAHVRRRICAVPVRTIHDLLPVALVGWSTGRGGR